MKTDLGVRGRWWHDIEWRSESVEAGCLISPAGIISKSMGRAAMARSVLFVEFLSCSGRERPLCIAGFCNKPASVASYISVSARMASEALGRWLLHVWRAILF